MELINDFTIDVGKQQSFKYLWAKQYDNNSRRYRLVITNQNVPLELTGKEYIVLSLEDSSGDNYSNTSCPFGDDGYPYIVFTDSMLSRAGDIKCELRVYDQKGDSVATTFTFNMEVSKSLLNQSRMVESSEFNVLNDLISQAIQIEDLIDDVNADKAELQELIAKVNSDIKSYQKDYTNLSKQTQDLIKEVQTFLDTTEANEQNRITAEQGRVTAEEKRKQDFETIKTETSEVISNATKATEKANTAIKNTETAITDTKAAAETATSSAASANSARDACLAAIETLKYTMVDLDGGEPASDSSLYVNDYNGGEP